MVLLAACGGYRQPAGQVVYQPATLKGVVYAPLGAVITKASVTVTNASTGFTKTVKCNAYGSYVIPVLQPGVYQIAVEAPGFQKELVKTFTLEVGTVSVYDAHLKVGASTEVVQVTRDSAPIAQT